ncbi:MAG: hypothetical protein U1E05_06505 [Patescibacteria group bacterium]|nr:hypothetical protein [Patescibacteria group bacterium]
MATLSLVFLLPGVTTLALFAGVWLRRILTSAGAAGRGDVSNRGERTAGSRATDRRGPRWLWLTAPFAVFIVLGGVLPPVDFDVLEYHLQAPKEFYGQGYVGFMPHNVYANMPLGVSMFALLAMSLTGDWWLGALVGKTLVALTAPLTAAALFAGGRRLNSDVAGAVAAVLYLSTPWVAHVAMAGLVESPLAMYSFLAVYAALILPQFTPADGVQAGGDRWRGSGYGLPLLAGYLAGAAVGCKYPAMLFVVLPLVAWTAFGWEATSGGAPAKGHPVGAWPSAIAGRLRSRWKAVALLLAAAALGGGLWFVKNWALTGNPTFPLLHSLFGDRTGTWSVEGSARWAPIHSPGSFSAGTLASDLFRLFLASEWLGPLLFPLALLTVLATLRRRSGRIFVVLAGYYALFLAAWWLLTHRIDRFWIPVLPVVALLAGVGMSQEGMPWMKAAAWRRTLGALLVLTSLVNLLVIVAPAPGNYKRFFVPLQAARTDPLRVSAWHRRFNAHRPEGTLLLVGDAAVFDLEASILYSTCFDETPLRRLAHGGTPEEIRRRFAEAGVSHVLVHWGEIARYRATYGFDPWVQPAILDGLVANGVLVPLPVLEDHPAQAYRGLPP